MTRGSDGADLTVYNQGGPYPEREHQVPLRRQAHRHAHAHPGRAVPAYNTHARMCACAMDMLGKEDKQHLTRHVCCVM